MIGRRFAVLDRDGTIIEERHHLSEPRQVALIQGAAGALRQLCAMGIGLVVITNQSVLGRGILDRERLDLIHERLYGLLAEEGVLLNGMYFCPHLPEDGCACRKPRSGLLELAAQELGFDPQSSFVIGDKPSDIELGQRVGATTFLVRTGYGAQVAAQGLVKPDYVVEDLRGAAQVIGSLLTKGERTAANAAGG